MNSRLENKISAAIAHRACCGTENDPQSGKLHGYCIVCGTPWPCETAKMFMFSEAVPDVVTHLRGMARNPENNVAWGLDEAAEEIEKLRSVLERALDSFAVTQTPSNYPANHWANEAIRLLKQCRPVTHRKPEVWEVP